MLIHTVKVGELLTNCYLVADEKTSQAVVIDPGDEPAKIIAQIIRLKLEPQLIVNTHAHPDHVGANLEIKKRFSIPVAAHAGEKIMFEAGLAFFAALGHDFKLVAPDRYVTDGEVFKFGSCSLTVLHTPGHSPGGICLYDGQGNLFSGDTLFKDGVGRVDLPGGSRLALSNSLREKIFRLPKNTQVYPGHGSKTTIEREETAVLKEMF